MIKETRSNRYFEENETDNTNGNMWIELKKLKALK